MRVVSWNMGRAMDAFADVHERAWHFLVSLGADIALVQEAIPPDWIRERFDIHAESCTEVPWCSAILARPGLSLRRVFPTPVLASFHWYVATAEVTLPDGSEVLVGSVHTTAREAFAKQMAGLDAEVIGHPSVDVPWMNDLGYFAYQELVLGRQFIVGGDIRVNWVDLKRVPGLKASTGRLGMTFLPGKQDTGSAGMHRRDLGRDVRWLRETYRMDAFVLLVRDHELQMLGVPQIADVMAANHIDLIRHPIEDGRIPNDLAAFGQTLDGIRARLAKGETVAVACRGGLGRTGTVVGTLLRDGGLDGKESIKLTRDSRHGTIENHEQERFVQDWSSR